jgi:hypothetical protein
MVKVYKYREPLCDEPFPYSSGTCWCTAFIAPRNSTNSCDMWQVFTANCGEGSNKGNCFDVLDDFTGAGKNAVSRDDIYDGESRLEPLGSTDLY